MELKHEFTVPATARGDLGGVQRHRVGGRVLPRRPGHLGGGRHLPGHRQGQARPDRAGLQRHRHVHREGRVGATDGDRRQGQGQARQRHRRRARHRHDDRRGGRQRPRSRCSPTSTSPASRRSSAAGDPGRQRQAARPVHRLPGEEGRRAAGRGAARRPPPRRPRGGGDRVGRRHRPCRGGPGVGSGRPPAATRPQPVTRSGGGCRTTTRWTSAPPCCRCWPRATGARA